MKRIISTICIVVMTVTSSLGQTSINNYKYAVLPQKFSFFKQKDHFKLNTLTRYLLKKNGFEVYYNSEEKPRDLEYNSCYAINVDVIKLKSFLKTRLKVQLKNCHDVVVFESLEGVSKNKNLGEAYKEALIMAFKSIESLNYSYQPEKSQAVSSNTLMKNSVEATIEDKSTNEKVETNKSVENKIKASNVLKAFPTKNGYALKDSKGKTIHQVLKSQRDDMYFLSNNEGVLYRKDGNKWVREFMKDDVVTTEVLYIEF